MKKIFYILASAIVALGAVACQNEVDENITPNETKEITFNVSFDESTRIAGTVAHGTATFAFEGTETLKVGDAVLTQESAGVFTADAENSAILNGLVDQTVTATVEDLGNGLKFASEEITLIAGENNITLSLACPALYFTVPAMTDKVNLTIGEETIWFDKTPEAKAFIRGIEGTEVYIKHAIGTEVVKETTLTNLVNKVYNLGTLDTDMTIANVAALIEKAEVGGTITLPAGATITGSEILTISKDITINGNGATLSSTAARAINIETTGEVNISNLTVECSGERVFNIINQPATVNISGVTATATNYAVMVATSAGAATVNVEKSTLTGLNVVNVAGAGAQVTVTDCTLNCNDNSDAESYAALILSSTAEGGSITATGCTINVNGDSSAAWNGSKTGTITAEGYEVKEAIACISYESGYSYSFDNLEEAIEYAKEGDTIVLIRDAEIAQAGTFPIDVNGKTLTAAEGFKIESIDEENNTVTVVTWITVANLATMIDNAEAGSTITLPAGATITGSEILTINKNITIDGNGATLTSTAGRAINVSGEGVVVAISNLNIECTGERGVNVIQNADKVTLTDVNITADNYAVNVASSAAGAVVVIDGGEYNGLNVVNVGGTATVTITGATINCNDNTSSESYSAIAINSNVENATINATNCTFNISGDSHIASNSGTNCSITLSPEGEVVENVAAINYGDYAYVFSTLAEAIEYANEKDNSATIVLLRDAEIAQAGTFKIDLNEHTLTAGDGFKIESNDEENNTVTVIVWNPVYLVPNASWNEASARFAAYFYDDTTNYWVDMTEEDGKYVANNTDNLPNVIFCRMNPATIENNWDNKWNQTGDLTFAKGDTFHMIGWTCGEWATLYTKKVYVKLNNNWSSTDTKRIAAYFFIKNTETSKWVKMTDMGENIYGIEVPTDKAYDQVIFCRMNTENSTLDWSAKWDQTKDLAIPTGNNRLYTIADGAWSSGDGSWE